MTSRQESKLNMYLAVKDFIETNTSILNHLPNYGGFATSFLNGITLIQNHSEQQMFDKSGLQSNKTQLKRTLVMLSADVSRKLQAYAKFNNNQLLLSETKYTESTLKNASDNELRDCAQGLYSRAQSNITPLAQYGITMATQTTYLSTINAFVTAIPKPRIGTADTKQSTLQLANAFKTVESALNNIDTIVEIVRLSNPIFYVGYKTVRKIIETSNGSLTVKGLVSDAVNGEPIKGVTIEFTLIENEMKNYFSKPSETFIKKTANKGGFNIKALAPGMYLVAISKNGYINQKNTIAVSDGEMTHLNIQLAKN